MTWLPWENLRTTDLGDRVDGRTVAVLPVAAVEQHGPHLPLGTDATILDGVLGRASDLHDAAAPVFVLPTQRVGNSLEHTSFPGTLHVEYDDLVRAWIALGRCVRRAGVPRLAIVNTHGGQPQLVDLVAQRLRTHEGLLVARIHTFRLGVPDGLFGGDELRHGLHGGEVETSLMLHLAPDLVDMAAARDFRSRAVELDSASRVLEQEGATGVAWNAEDLHASGATGHAAAADAGRGAVLLEHLASRVAAAIDDLASWPLPGADA